MFRGSLVALVTPMTESGDVDMVAFARLLDWHAREGSDGVVVGGTTGESATLSAAEAAELLQIAVQRLGGRMPVIAGTGGASTSQAVERTRAACELGADGVLVVTPYYNRPPQEGLYRHFSMIADASSVPLILYNVPSRTACDLLPETVERLSGHPQIIGIKEATGSVARGREILERCGDDFLLLSGDDAVLPRTDRRGRAGRRHGDRERRAAAHARDGRGGPARRPGGGEGTRRAPVGSAHCAASWSRTRSRPSGRSGGSG